MSNMLNVKGLSISFGGLKAVNNFAINIEKGQLYGLIGPNGAGKSTLVRCINLLERPTSGTVTVDGQELTSLSERELRQARKKISMIFQSFNLLMQRTCLKNVCFPMELSGVPRVQAEKKAQELLELVGLKEKANAYPSQLSGGQKQRVAIARALATDPKVLLCDEATSALDPTTTNSILSLLKELNQKLGVTVVIITHNSALTAMADRVISIKSGTIQSVRKNEHVTPVEEIEW